MSRATVILTSRTTRERVASWAFNAPTNTVVEFRQNKRSLPQNARMWAMLTEVARQVEWHGVKLSADDWKLVFLEALGQEMRLVPNINGNGFVNLGRRSSELTKQEMTDLIELIFSFGANYGVTFKEEQAA